MTRFKLGETVYPVFYPEQDTKCTVIEIDGKCSCGCDLKVLITKSEDGRIIDEIEECFLKEGETMADLFGQAVYVRPPENCPLPEEDQVNCITCPDTKTCSVKPESIF